ncbi:MAG: alpha/beta hydrolase [Verrucomicrobiae bacterium]|nr:alpha/beta hydrolase [Verrucomicrobiae bacterium]
MHLPTHHRTLSPSSIVLLVIALVFCTTQSPAEPTPPPPPDHVINIWPNQPPGEPREIGEEQDMTKDTDSLIAGRRIIKLGNVTTPQAHVYLAPEAKRSGASVVICPGGGFSILAWDLEGTEVAQWLNELGITAIVLKYRVPTRDQNPMWMAPAQDTQRAVSIARHHAGDWHLDPDKVAVLGFSAGGAAAIKTALAEQRYYDPVDAADAEACRPNRAILIYSGGLPADPDKTSDAKPERIDRVKPSSPPMFLAHAFDDFVPVEGTARLMLELKKANVPSELHIYDAGGHGYGLRKRDDLPVTTWTAPCEAWLRRAGWIR